MVETLLKSRNIEEQTQFETNSIDIIRAITKDIRQREIERRIGLNYSKIQKEIAKGERHDPLLGSCYKNACTLARRLKQHGFEPHLIWGMIAPSEHIDIPNSVKDINSYIHFWVEVNPERENLDKDKYVIAEIAKETKGGWHVTTTLPTHYHRLNGSRIRYDDAIMDLSIESPTMDDYDKFKNEGLIVE